MSKPPSDLARLVLFCELVDEYDDLAKAFPIEQTSLELVPVSTEPAVDRWARIVRAMALRKFALSSGDHVYIPTVFDSVERCLTDPAVLGDVHAFRDRFHELGLAIKVQEGPDPSDERTAAHILKDLIYGGFLHGDYERHQRVKVRPHMTHDLALWVFLADVEQYVRRLRSVIRAQITSGALADLSSTK